MHRIASFALLFACVLITACGSDADQKQPTSTADTAVTDPSQSLEPGSAGNGVLHGRIVGPDGQPLAGAMVKARLDRRSVTVFSGNDGAFRFPAVVAGGAPLTITYPGLEASTESASAGETHELAPAADPTATIPGSRWLALLPDQPERNEFVLNCGTCHSIAKSRIYQNGVARDKAGWLAGIAMMRAIDAYSVIPPDFDDDAYAAWLAEHLSATAAEALQPPPPVSAELAERLVITEYELPRENTLPHDVAIGPDGRIWITGFLYDEMWALEPDSGEYTTISVDDDPQLNAQPRALEFAADGDLWIVNGGTNSVIRLDTETGEYESFDVGMYAHSIALDTEGNVWVNDYFAAEERVARIDAATGEIEVIPVPSASLPEPEGLPLPYGLQVDDQDRVYSTQLAANTLVVLDSRTGESRLHEMPAANSGPRRPGLGPDGALWIPEFNTGYLARFDPESGEFQRVDLGLATLGAYDVAVDQSSGAVWITGSLDSSLLRYLPESGRIDRIPFPTEPAYTRHIAIDRENGDVWTAYSSLPPAIPRVVRVQLR